MASKKLIEVALPLEKINAESAREKSIRHGHPSTLHLWWARRPLAAARAVIWASLVDDPSSHLELFPTEEDQTKERQRLFRILENLVVWENSNDENVLRIAKEEILKSTNNNPPALLDPFAGGGAIPLEAQRLGLKTYAHDLNPVAVMINKAMIEIPSLFSGVRAVNPNGICLAEEIWSGTKGLMEDVQYYGQLMKSEAYSRIGHLYPKIKDKDGQEYTVIAWIWARTVASPNPLAHGAYVPLVSSFVLSTKKGNQAWINIVEDSDAKDGWRFEVETGLLTKELEKAKGLGTKAGKATDFVCCLTNSPIPRDYIQEEGKAGRLSKRLMSIVAFGRNGRVYLSPDQIHETIALSVDNDDSVQHARVEFLNGGIPTRAMVTGGVCSAYGLSTWGHLYTSRQIKALLTFSDLVNYVQKQAEKDAIAAGMSNDHIPLSDNGKGALAYGQAIGVYTALIISKLADRGSSLCGWDSSREGLRNTFGRQALPMVWDYAEGNPFSSSSGCFDNMLEWVTKCINMFPASTEGVAEQFDAQSDCGFRDIMVSTDPPYYDNIDYSDLSDFFYVWIRRSLRTTYSELFNTMLVPKGEELIAVPFRHGGSVEKAKQFFEDGMLQACKLMYQYSCDNIPVTIYYAYKQNDTLDSEHGQASSGWETMLTAIIKAGFAITGTWPMRTEMANRAVASGTNALASSIVLVCRKRDQEAEICTRRIFINELKRELRPALLRLQSSNIAPVDLAQSAIGPGIGVYSKYSRVLEADGTPMTVRSALKVINQEIDLYFNEQDSDIDSESRFCVDLFSQFAFNEISFGDANTLATAKNTSVAIMVSHGILYAQKGKVHLVERAELPEKIDEHESGIWLLCQQLSFKMEKEGVEGCATAIANMFGSNAERAKDLAYRLYTIAERKRWAQEAYVYNALVVAWPEIQSRAAELKATKPEQLTLFDIQ
jgi:putative DNA methylase